MIKQVLWRKKWHLVLVAVIVVIAAACSREKSAVPLVQRGIWIGAYAPPAPWDSMDAVHDLERSIGRKLDLVHIYKAWGDPWGQYNDQTIRELTLATADNRRALITWEPWVLSQGVDQPNFSLASITAGRYDSYIRSWAYGLRDFPGIVYPWAGGVNGNTAGGYIAAWRHMHDIFDQEGVGNVRWVWSPYALDVPMKNRFETYYPGRKYVDILALDAYNWGVSDSNSGHRSERRWQEVDELMLSPYQRLANIGAQAVWLTEVGSAEEGGDKARWLQTLLESHNYTRIRAVVWFDADKERDWRITSSARVTSLVARVLIGTRPAIEADVARTEGEQR
jgi:hypothetical protein